MDIISFVNGYKNMATEGMKNDYLRENLKVVDYLPIIEKDKISDRIANISTYEYEKYKDGNGKDVIKRTGNIKVNTTLQYLLFCRAVIENYTNLTVKSEDFFAEYDALKSSGLLTILMVEYENHPSIIPASEISELNTMILSKQSDILKNECEIHNFIRGQIERFGKLANITITPLLDVIKEKIIDIPKEDINTIVDMLKNGDFKEA